MRREHVINDPGRPCGTLRGQGSGRYLLREQSAGRRVDTVLSDGREEEREDEGPGLFCRSCGHWITSENDRIAVNGSHTHTFFNPAGLVFELGCFRRAPGSLVDSEASDQFTWFAGYSWRPAFCARCAAHLGWRYESGEQAFYSLILAKLQNG